MSRGRTPLTELVFEGELLLVERDGAREHGCCNVCPTDRETRRSSHVDGPTYLVTIGPRGGNLGGYVMRFCGPHVSRFFAEAISAERKHS